MLITPNLLSPYSLRMGGRNCAPSRATPSTKLRCVFLAGLSLWGLERRQIFNFADESFNHVEAHILRRPFILHFCMGVVP